MNAYEHILSKQVEWARNNELDLVGSQINRGRPAYTRTLESNLFEPLSPNTKESFQRGDGGELNGNPSKMQAVHSSSALGVNIFQFWENIGRVYQIAHACGFCRKTTKISRSVSFEIKYPINDNFRYSPNIDVVINNDPSSRYKVFAIESKFTEAYGGRGHSGIKPKYLDLEIWGEIPRLHELANTLNPKDNRFQYLHAAQLIKHILGLKREFGKTGFRLLYLWYDAIGNEGAKHRGEINEFLEIAKADEIAIHELSYQDLIIRLANEYRDSHGAYVEYITSRYL